MKYKEARAYIDDAKKYGIVPGLTTMQELLTRLGNPQKELKFIHVAGTNGKGSVLAFLFSVLCAAGYKTGRYTSPDVFSYEEKFQVGKKAVSKREFGMWMEAVKEKSEEMASDGFLHPTAFELETAFAFLYFKEAGCQYVLLETGMGGCMDATNVVDTTILSVFTSIGMDHMQFLGETLFEIAEQKAGILKPGVPAVTLRQQEDAKAAVRRKAEETASSLFLVEREFCRNIRYGFMRQRFDFHSPYGNYEDLEIRMAGRHQIENASLAVAAVGVLREQGLAITDDALRTGLGTAVWEGRMSVICEEPLFLIDGAHNKDAAKVLRDSIEQYFTNREIIYIMGVFRDKEYEAVVAETVRCASHIITVTPPENPRALSALELAKTVQEYHGRATAASSVREAVEMSFLLAKKDTVIIAFGSLSYLGELKKIVQESANLTGDTGKRV